MKGYCLGLALGSGSARGWAHIGVIKALRDMGIEPDIICGCSSGALVGGMYAAGYMEEFEAWIGTLTRKKVATFFDVNIAGGGLIAGERLFKYFRERFGDVAIESLSMPYSAVSADLSTGREVWLRSGSLFDSIRASISLPGIFPPVMIDGKWLVDGGIVNPVPVSICRAMNADIVIAVNLNGGLVGKHISHNPESDSREKSNADNDIRSRIKRGIKNGVDSVLSQVWPFDGKKPGIFDVIAGSINIMQDRITRSRMAGDPADIVLMPRLEHIGLLEFYRVGEAVEEGIKAALAAKELLNELRWDGYGN